MAGRMKVYLCGGINGLSDADCKDWRVYAKKHLTGETIDPMRRDYRGREAEHVNEIVNLDKIDVLECDIVLANASKPSWGTAMEILFAWMNGKPVVSVVPDGPVSPWVKKHSTMVLQSLDEAINRINGHR